MVSHRMGFPMVKITRVQLQTSPSTVVLALELPGIFRILRPVTIALDIIVLVLSVIAAIGLFKTKRWAAIMAIVVSVLVILLTIPSMIRIFSTVTLVENLVTHPDGGGSDRASAPARSTEVICNFQRLMMQEEVERVVR